MKFLDRFMWISIVLTMIFFLCLIAHYKDTKENAYAQDKEITYHLDGCEFYVNHSLTFRPLCHRRDCTNSIHLKKE